MCVNTVPESQVKPTNPASANFGVHADDFELYSFGFGTRSQWEFPWERRYPKGEKDVLSEIEEMARAVIAGNCEQRRGPFWLIGKIRVGDYTYKVTNLPMLPIPPFSDIVRALLCANFLLFALFVIPTTHRWVDRGFLALRMPVIRPSTRFPSRGCQLLSMGRKGARWSHDANRVRRPVRFRTSNRSWRTLLVFWLDSTRFSSFTIKGLPLPAVGNNLA